MVMNCFMTRDLLDVMKLHQEEMQEYMTQIGFKAENVLEVLLSFSKEIDFQNTNRKFFRDVKISQRCALH